MKKIRIEKKTNVRNSIMRLFFVAVAILFQLFLILNWLGAFRILPYQTNAILHICAIIVSLWVYGRDKNASINIAWMLLILALPMVGLVLYAMMGRASLTDKMRKVYADIDAFLFQHYQQDDTVFACLKKEHPYAAGQSRLIWQKGNFPVYDDTQVKYYGDAYDGFLAQIEEMKKAKKFIFLEYHAIEDGPSFKMMKDVLIQKAKEGVEVRIFYDDMGSIGFINKDFIRQMESYDIQCRVFNPLRPWILVFMNNRDHRKITVIDGKVGFTGGYNLAEEYFNKTHPYGYWKDSGVKIEGKAVDSLTLIFLEMWNAVEQTDQSIDQYLCATASQNDGYVQPYADSPLDDEYLGEDVYMNICNHAIDYAYFVTPYLILTDEMVRTFTLAAKRGVDVRIITPGIPDKKFTYMLTRSFYRDLVMNGVKIYEYTPGFCHAKMSISDGKIATCGTINLDYRSLYLHFENGLYMVDCDCIKDIKADFEQMFKESKEVTCEYKRKVSVPVRTYRAILRLLSPLF